MSSTVNVAGHQVGRMGYGLMQLTWTAKPVPDITAFAAMKAAADHGSTCWSSATFYGPPDDRFANLKLIRRFFDTYPEYKNQVVLAVKGGVDFTSRGPVGDDLDFLRDELKTSKDILGDKAIDVFSVARLPNSPVEDVFKGLVTLQKEGWYSAIAASEMSAASLEKASKITPIALNEIEVSLISYEPSIRAAIAWSQTNKVPFFAYSPLGRGLLTRTYKTPEDAAGQVAGHIPRFQGDAFYENMKLVDLVEEIAGKKGVKAGELALAWVYGTSDYAVPIPGSSKPERVIENINAANIKLTPDELKAISNLLETFEVKGGRYADHAIAHLMK
ncbi:hypothetical protein L202_06897 [Cryptococcus amylolentus CBS 6039]|uniref:NADP-dependent oxidoreductase domain-containing protein n=1 Tax=Cryptococcus amylolentus CBS 6039 TaxID=1295533 RepID=A0A1E3HDX3_9TREE|nr:hypothetical protein L202_06897 [Cryptococcus amylolentus CBS 6039]ODN74524.1 hypothetical protein L202_06897 [Cryptococcus amylolentus CBS 6039]